MPFLSMDAQSIERVVRGAVSTALTRIVNERQQTSGNGDNSDSEADGCQPGIQNSTQKKRYRPTSYVHIAMAV